jgi:mRNA-degrading endonuclease RelE of RelBE toxin-antitoxin system
MKRIFVELPIFRKSIDSLPNGHNLLKEIQETLLETPEVGDVITGTGGLRKMRHGSSSKGKRGGYRITYLYRVEVEKVYLFTIYSKNEKENLSEAEKKFLKKLVETLKGEERNK